MRLLPGDMRQPFPVTRNAPDSFGASARRVVCAGALIMGGVSPTFPAPAAGQSGEPLTAHETIRTERFLTNRVACRGCHLIAGSGGSIGPALDGIGSRADYAYVVDMIRDPGGTVPGSLMPVQQMPAREAERLARFILSASTSASGTDPAEAPQAPPALGPGEENSGPALYARHCAACHGEAGGGDGWNATNLPVVPTAHADSASMSARADDTLYDAIAGGGYVLDRSPLMPAFGAMLTPPQIRALVAHIRTLCSCSQPAWAGGGFE